MITFYTFAHKRPDFIPLQVKSFDKYVKEPYKFVVFNNASFDIEKTQYNEIHQICNQLNIECIDVLKCNETIEKIETYYKETTFSYESGIYVNSVIACAYSLCWAWWEYISKQTGFACIIDSDMFYFSNDTFVQTFKEYDLIFLYQSRINVSYIWNGIVFMNLDKLPEKDSLCWYAGLVNNEPVDVGGQTHWYLQKYIKKLKLFHVWCKFFPYDKDCDFSPSNYELFGNRDGLCILHYRGGSNWDNQSKEYHEKKTKWLIEKINVNEKV